MNHRQRAKAAEAQPSPCFVCRIYDYEHSLAQNNYHRFCNGRSQRVLSLGPTLQVPLLVMYFSLGVTISRTG